MQAPRFAGSLTDPFTFERDLLRPEIVERAIELAIDELRPDGDTLNQRRAALLTEIRVAGAAAGRHGPSSFGGDPGGSPAVLYSVQDVPLLRALGFYRVDA